MVKHPATTSDAPIRGFADILITDYLLANTNNRSDNKITTKSSHDYTMNCHETCLII